MFSSTESAGAISIPEIQLLQAHSESTIAGWKPFSIGGIHLRTSISCRTSPPASSLYVEKLLPSPQKSSGPEKEVFGSFLGRWPSHFLLRQQVLAPTIG